MKATVLCENAVYGNPGVLAEHGWAVWLETDAGPFLFDTGRGNTLLNNVAHFSIPLGEARAILLSHHHSDHTGGLLDAVAAIRRDSGRERVPVHAHPDLFKDSFYQGKERLSFVGVPHTRGALETTGAQFQLSTQWQQIATDVYMTGEIPRRTSYEYGDRDALHFDGAGQMIVDPIRDDQTVVVDTPDGLFVVLGCSHAGLINILTRVMERTGKERFHTIMGGTHLGPVSEEQISRTIDALHGFDIQRLGVSHCTGPNVAARLAHEFGERFFFCSVGTVAEA
ncbi:MAG TPA: MBL fold metallo-hydrolase [Thermomicrobiales bacterium]|nr:MBL fold metallo-hydrolase [Thermomicrobiales bacterium]